jgi:hypothetical protein
MKTFLPANRPRLERGDALSRISPIRPGEVVVIGIRGYYQSAAAHNQRGIYDDAMCVVGPEHFSAYNANVDPSLWRQGIASLRPGVHPYRPGRHGLSRPGGGYPAFRPATPGEALPVNRDGIAAPEPGIAINIHRGGRGSTSSEGCQTIHPDQWDAFYAALSDQLKRARQAQFNYHLVG